MGECLDAGPALPPGAPMASTQVNIPIGLWPSGCWRAGTPMEIPKLDRLTDIELNIIGYVITNFFRVRAGGA